MAENTSGTSGSVPEEIKGWSWGAFWLDWKWGIGNSVWVSFVALVLPLIWHIYLGVKGNELAWQNRKFESVQQFKDTQAVWSKWGWIIFIISVVANLLFMFLMGGLAFLGIAASESGNF